MKAEILPQKQTVLARKLVWKITLAHVFLVGIMLLSAILHFSNLEAIGDANTYYTATVKSMLQSSNNFFFGAAEPGGSVTVDKPPMGLWIEAAFAFFLGVEGWVVSLPNILAGIFSVPVLYYLVKKYMGELAGLVAALVLVATPVAIATDRNNTMDGMLIFTLLLAAWAFIKATETGKSRWLYLGAFIVGLGFNIKMLQAFLPLPAFYAFYFFGSKAGWGKKVFSLGAATVLLLAVSLSWAVIVDLTPENQRPYIGSSDNNTVMELIVGHNGLSRLFNARQQNAQNATPASNGNPPANLPPNSNNPYRQNAPSQTGSPPPQALDACENQSLGESCSFTLKNGNTIDGICIRPPGTNQLACAPQSRLPQVGQSAAGAQANQQPVGALGDGPNASPGEAVNDTNNATPFSQETGAPGITRFFVWPLSKQMSWLLPFALASIILAIFATRIRLPLEPEHKALVLWGGWLLTCLVFFSSVEGIFHAYYAIMLAPALGAVVGAGVSQFWRWLLAGMIQAGRPWASVVFVLMTLVTIIFQIFTASQYGVQSAWVYLPLAVLLIGIGLLVFKSIRPTGFLTVMTAMLIIPLAWTAITVLDKAPNVNIPTSFDGSGQTQTRAGASQKSAPQLNEPNKANIDLVAFLQANTQDIEYLVAVPNSHTGSPLVLETGRPVLYMGGFTGSDPVIDANGLSEMVANGELRYVLYGGNRGNKQDISRWLTSACTVVPQFSQGVVNEGNRPDQLQSPQGGGMILYQCGG